MTYPRTFFQCFNQKGEEVFRWFMGAWTNYPLESHDEYLSEALVGLLKISEGFKLSPSKKFLNRLTLEAATTIVSVKVDEKFIALEELTEYIQSGNAQIGGLLCRIHDDEFDEALDTITSQFFPGISKIELPSRKPAFQGPPLN